MMHRIEGNHKVLRRKTRGPWHKPIGFKLRGASRSGSMARSRGSQFRRASLQPGAAKYHIPQNGSSHGPSPGSNLRAQAPEDSRHLRAKAIREPLSRRRLLHSRRSHLSSRDTISRPWSQVWSFYRREEARECLVEQNLEQASVEESNGLDSLRIIIRHDLSVHLFVVWSRGSHGLVDYFIYIDV